jgi:hypothetical protein
VVRLDREALNCDVLFEGSLQPVPVALRHLQLVQPDAPLTASATAAAALRSGSCPAASEASKSVASQLWRFRTGDGESEDISSVVEAKVLSDVRVEAVEARAMAAERRVMAMEMQVGAHMATGSASNGQHDLLSGSVQSGTSLREDHGSCAFLTKLAMGGYVSPESKSGQQADTPEVQSPSPSLLVDHMFGSNKERDPCFTFSGPAEQATSSTSAGSQKDLAVRLAMVEHRYNVEVASLRSALEDALAFGRRQEARATALEEKLQMLQAAMPGSPQRAAAPGMGDGSRASACSPYPRPPHLTASGHQTGVGIRFPLAPSIATASGQTCWPAAAQSASWLSANQTVRATSPTRLTSLPAGYATPSVVTPPLGVTTQVSALPLAASPGGFLEASPSSNTSGKLTPTPLRASDFQQPINVEALTSHSGSANGVRRSLSASAASSSRQFVVGQPCISGPGVALSGGRQYLVAQPVAPGQPVAPVGWARLRQSSHGPPGVGIVSSSVSMPTNFGAAGVLSSPQVRGTLQQAVTTSGKEQPESSIAPRAVSAASDPVEIPDASAELAQASAPVSLLDATTARVCRGLDK